MDFISFDALLFYRTYDDPCLVSTATDQMCLLKVLAIFFPLSTRRGLYPSLYKVFINAIYNSPSNED